MVASCSLKAAIAVGWSKFKATERCRSVCLNTQRAGSGLCKQKQAWHDWMLRQTKIKMNKGNRRYRPVTEETDIIIDQNYSLIQWQQEKGKSVTYLQTEICRNIAGQAENTTPVINAKSHTRLPETEKVIKAAVKLQEGSGWINNKINNNIRQFFSYDLAPFCYEKKLWIHMYHRFEKPISKQWTYTGLFHCLQYYYMDSVNARMWRHFMWLNSMFEAVNPEAAT